MAPRVSVIVVNWNGRRHLPECLDSLAAQTFRDFEVVLVDNGSSDDSVALVERDYPTVRILPLAENTGFARGNNLGFAEAHGEYLVALNNDTRVAPGWLAALVAAADGDPQLGMVGSRICVYDEPDRLDSIGVAICSDGMSRAAFRRQRFSRLGMSGIVEILLPSACAALYRRAMIEEVGGFDEAFFAYCEDTDLGLRGRRAGWGAVAALDAVVLHKYSQTGGALSPFKLRLVERNHLWVAVKNFSMPALLLLPLTTLQRFCWQGVAFLSGSWRPAATSPAASGNTWPLLRALLGGIIEGLGGVPRVLRQRAAQRTGWRLAAADWRRLLKRYRLSYRELFAAGE